MKDKIRKSLIDSGFATAKVDEVFKDLDKLPEELVNSYIDMSKQEVKDRLAKDEDYQEIKKSDHTTLNYEYLDKFWFSN